MNYFSNDQIETLDNHIKFMMDTNKFDFVIYFAKSYNCNKSGIIPKLSNYDFNPNSKYENLIRFTSYNQLTDYIHNCFESDYEFYNQFFIMKNALIEDTANNNPFIKSISYLKDTFGEKLKDEFEAELVKTFTKNQHMILFNFLFKHNDLNETDKVAEYITAGNDNPNSIMFFSEQLNEVEKEYFMNQYKFHEIFSNASSSLQIEQTLSNELFDYRYNFSVFESICSTIKKYEDSIKNYLLPKFNEYEILKFGKNKQYLNSLEEVLYKIVENFTSKKVAFRILNDLTKEPFKLTFTHNNLRYNRSEKIKQIVYNAFPEKTANMLGSYFECNISLMFETPLSMQVKHSLMHKLTNYMINNNIHVEDVMLLDENKVTKPAEGIIMRFICNSFENIGINPIKFMIPKLGMKH